MIWAPLSICTRIIGRPSYMSPEDGGTTNSFGPDPSRTTTQGRRTSASTLRSRSAIKCPPGVDTRMTARPLADAMAHPLCSSADCATRNCARSTTVTGTTSSGPSVETRAMAPIASSLGVAVAVSSSSLSLSLSMSSGMPGSTARLPP